MLGTDDFVNVAGNGRVDYGVATDCLVEHWEGGASQENTEGTFSIDLRGSGLAVSTIVCIA